MPNHTEQITEDFRTGLRRVMLRYYPAILEDAYDAAAATLGIDSAFNLDNPQVQEILDTLLDRIATDVPATLKEEMQSLIGRQAAEGWDLDTLAAAIQERAEDWSTNRARLVAVSETASAYSRGSILAYQASGVVDEIEWLTTDGACPICEPLNGRRVTIGDEFDTGILHPGAHPACRCSLIPVVKER